MRGRLVSVLWALATLAAPRLVGAQEAPQVVDRIVAVVGDRAILLSEIDEEILLLQSQGQQPPTDSGARAAFRRQVLERMIDEEVLFQRARRDTTITVSDAEVQSAVDEQVRRVRSQFPNETEYRTQLLVAGFGTPEEYRRWLAEQHRRAEFQRRYLDKLRQEGKLRPGAVSEEEVRRAFEQALSERQIPRRPPTVTFRHVVVKPRPTEEARAAARLRAESALVEIRGGADFATVARRLSDDPVSREQGGDLGWNRRGTFVTEFERVAFRLRPGDVSNVVETQFGFHIIEVDRVQPGEIKVRHVLMAPAISERELAAARAVADTVAALVRTGAAFDSLYARYSDTTEGRLVGPVERSRLPREYVAAFEGRAPDAIAGPFAVDADTPARTKYVVARLDDVQPERDYTFEEVRSQIRQNLQQDRAVRDLRASLRTQTYVSVRL